MNKINYPHHGVQALYELSLSIEHSNDLLACCKSFLKSLKKTQKLSFVSIWLYRQDRSYLDMVFAKPKTKVLEKQILSSHPIINKIKRKNYYSFFSNEDKDQALMLEQNLPYACHTIIKLGKLGFLKMHSVHRESKFSKIEFDTLSPILTRFTQSIENCIDFHNLTNEKDLIIKKNKDHQFKLAIKNIPEGIIISDLNNNIIYINDRLVQLSGYSKDEIIGKKTHAILIQRGAVKDIENKIKQTFKGKTVSYEVVHIKKGTNDKWYSKVEVAPYRNEDGKIIGSIGIIRDITDRKIAEKALKISRQNAELAIQGAQLGFWHWNFISNKTTYNNFWFEMLGFKPNELEHNLETFKKLLHPEDETKFWESINHHIKHKTDFFEAEFRMKTKSGKWIWIYDRGKVVKWSVDGNPLRLSGTHMDINERREALLKIQESEQKFRSLFEESPLGIAIKYPDNDKLVSNTRFSEMLGYTPAEFKKLQISDFSPPSEEKIIEDKTKELEDNNLKSLQFEKKYIHKNGSIVWGNISIAGIYDEKKKIKIRLGIVEDITTKKKALLDLAASENQLKLAQEIGKIGSYHYDVINDKLVWTDKLKSLFGFKQEPQTSEYLQLVHPDDRAKHKQEIEELLAFGKGFKTDVRFINSKGITRYFSTSSKAILGEDGKPTDIIGIAQDITERKTAERALFKSEARLKSIFNNTTDKVFAIDNQFKLIAFNEASKTFAKFFGKRKLKVGTKIISPKAQENNNEWLDIFNRCLNDEHITIEKRYKIKGIEHTDLININPIKDQNSKVIGCTIYGKDITELVEARKKLKASEEKFRNLYENSPIGVVMLTTDNKLLANKKFAEFTGYSQSELSKKISSEITHPEDVTKHLEQFELLLAQKITSFNLQKRYIHKNGDIIWGNVSISALYAENGDILTPIAMVEDITEKKSAQIVVKESEERFRNIYLQSPLGIVMNASTGGLIANPAFCKMIGYSKEELTKLSHEDIFHPDDKALPNLTNLYQQKGETINLHKKYLHKDGEAVWGNVIISPIFDINHKVTDHMMVIQDISQTIKSDRELAENKARLNLALEAGQLGTWDWNAITGKCFYNQRWANILGFELDEVDQNDTFFNKYLHPDDATATYQALNDHLAGKTAFYENEFRMYNRHGEIVWIYGMGIVSERDSNNQAIRVTGIHLDITERKKKDAAIQKSETRLLEAQRLAKVGNWEYIVETREVKWSEEVFKMFDFKDYNATVHFDDYAKLVHPEDLPELKEVLKNSVINGVSAKREMRSYTQDGELIYTIGKAIPLIEDGKVIKLYGTIQDITELKRTELDLIETTRKYTDLFENMYDALLIVNEEGLFEDANKAAQKLLGYPLEELKTISIADIVYEEDKEHSKKYLEKLIKDGYYSDYVGRIVTKNNEVKYLQVNSNAIYDDKGNFIGSRDLARDITALKEAEDKKEQLFDELKFVNKELKDFAYIVSHDLKAPLRAISSLTQFIKEDYEKLLDDAGKAQLDLLIGRTKRMHNFIEAILAYSRIGRIKIEKEKVDINQLVKEIIQVLNPPNDAKIIFKNKLPTIYCEKLRIEQVFQNLISNALKHNNKGNKIVYLASQDLPSHVQFSVSDNGPGINAKYFDKIFQIFQTLNARDHVESTGVGLSIVKRIIQAHKGTIEVQSTLDEGSRFIFTIKKEEIVI